MRQSRVAVLLAVTASAGGLLVGGIALLGSMMSATSTDSGSCSTEVAAVVPASGGSHAGDLTSAQLANAGAIITEGRRMNVPPAGIVVALAVALAVGKFGKDLRATEVIRIGFGLALVGMVAVIAVIPRGDSGWALFIPLLIAGVGLGLGDVVLDRAGDGAGHGGVLVGRAFDGHRLEELSTIGGAAV